MVYCGKLSRDCQQCRKRKLRCDLRPNGCSQCHRAHVPCSGYRDPNQLRIRDESQRVTQKAVKYREKNDIPKALTVSLSERARGAFFSNYVFHHSKSYDFLEPFYWSDNVDKTLLTSIEAVSLAFFAHQENSLLASNRARSRYVCALSSISIAVRCPAHARKDSTLLATMLLDLYEKITNSETSRLDSWKSHVQGALALVGLRGPNLFENRAQFRILIRLSTNLLISCVASDTPLPVELVALRAYESKFLDNKDPKWQLSDLMIYYIGLRESIRKGDLTDSEMITSLISLDSKFAALAANMPATWQYRTISLQTQTKCALDGYFHVYKDYYITQTWNVLRMIRILINEMLQYCACTPTGLACNTSGTLPLRKAATGNIENMISEVCASVPQYIFPEITQYESDSELNISTARISNTVAAQPPTKYTAAVKVRAYTLLFPLFVAGRCLPSEDHRKLWMIRQLHFMAREMAIKNAEVVAKVLESGQEMNPWAVYALLGSYAFAA